MLGPTLNALSKNIYLINTELQTANFSVIWNITVSADDFGVVIYPVEEEFSFEEVSKLFVPGIVAFIGPEMVGRIFTRVVLAWSRALSLKR